MCTHTHTHTHTHTLTNFLRSVHVSTQVFQQPVSFACIMRIALALTRRILRSCALRSCASALSSSTLETQVRHALPKALCRMWYPAFLKILRHSRT